MLRTRYLVVLLTAVLCYAALGAVLGILPDYVRSLGGGAVLVGLAVGAPALTGAAGRPLGGRLADRWGPARVMIAGALVMAAGTIPGFVPSLPLLIVSRLTVGAGEASMMAATVLWLLRLAGPERRGRAMGHIGLANYAGLTVGPPLRKRSAQRPTQIWCGSPRRCSRLCRPRSRRCRRAARRPAPSTRSRTRSPGSATRRRGARGARPSGRGSA